MSADSMWTLPNVSERNMNACGFVDRECESIWGSPGAGWTSYGRPLFLLSFPNTNSSTVTQPMLHSPAVCGSTVWTQRVDWPTQTVKDGQKYVLLLLLRPWPSRHTDHIKLRALSDQIWTESDATDYPKSHKVELKDPKTCLNVRLFFFTALCVQVQIYVWAC